MLGLDDGMGGGACARHVNMPGLEALKIVQENGKRAVEQSSPGRKYYLLCFLTTKPSETVKLEPLFSGLLECPVSCDMPWNVRTWAGHCPWKLQLLPDRQLLPDCHRARIQSSIWPCHVGPSWVMGPHTSRVHAVTPTAHGMMCRSTQQASLFRVRLTASVQERAIQQLSGVA